MPTHVNPKKIVAGCLQAAVCLYDPLTLLQRCCYLSLWSWTWNHEGLNIYSVYFREYRSKFNCKDERKRVDTIKAPKTVLRMYQYPAQLGYWYFINIDSNLHKPVNESERLDLHNQPEQPLCPFTLGGNVEGGGRPTRGTYFDHFANRGVALLESNRLPPIPSWSVCSSVPPCYICPPPTVSTSLFTPITKHCQWGCQCCAEECGA